MNNPREIVRKFQDRLASTGFSGSACIQESEPIGNAVKQLIPYANGLDSRIKKVKNLFQESCQMINESRVPALNTTSNSCQKCSCNNSDINQSAVLGSDLLNSTLTSIMQSYEIFMESQRQLFMQFLLNQSQVITTLNSSVSGERCQQPAKNDLSGSSCNQKICWNSPKSSEAIEGGSKQSEINRSRSDSEVCADQRSTAEQPELDSPLSTFDMSSDDCLSTITVITGKESNQPEMLNASNNFRQSQCDKTQKHLDVSSFNSVDDLGFKPIRKSTAKKMSACSVELTRINLTETNEAVDNEPSTVLTRSGSSSFENHVERTFSKASKPDLHLDAHLKASWIANSSQLSLNTPSRTANSKLNLQLKVPKENKQLECAKDIKAAQVPDNSRTTRSGRTIKDPNQIPYWLSSSRVPSSSVTDKIVPARKTRKKLTQVHPLSEGTNMNDKSNQSSINMKKKDGNKKARLPKESKLEVNARDKVRRRKNSPAALSISNFEPGFEENPKKTNSTNFVSDLVSEKPTRQRMKKDPLKLPSTSELKTEQVDVNKGKKRGKRTNSQCDSELELNSKVKGRKKNESKIVSVTSGKKSDIKTAETNNTTTQNKRSKAIITSGDVNCKEKMEPQPKRMRIYHQNENQISQQKLYSKKKPPLRCYNKKISVDSSEPSYECYFEVQSLDGWKDSWCED